MNVAQLIVLNYLNILLNLFLLNNKSALINNIILVTKIPIELQDLLSDLERKASKVEL